MRTGTIEAEINVVQEPQLDILYYPKPTIKIKKEESKETLNVLSLFFRLRWYGLGF